MSEITDEDQLEDIFKEDLALQQKIQNMLKQKCDMMDQIDEAKKDDEVDEISDFGDQDDGEAAVNGEQNGQISVLKSKSEAQDFVQESIEVKVIKDLLADYLAKTMRV